MSKLAQTCPVLSILIQTCPVFSKLVQTCPDMLKMKICKKLRQYLKFEKNQKSLYVSLVSVLVLTKGPVSVSVLKH